MAHVVSKHGLLASYITHSTHNYVQLIICIGLKKAREINDIGPADQNLFKWKNNQVK